MALTVTERPIGHKILDSGTSFTIFNSGGKAGFTDSLSLTTGDYIYISGYVENYNGFWYVDKSGGIVYLKSNADSDRLDFIVEANVTVFTTEDHGWSCAHLPIVYKLESNLFPVNSVDTIVTINPYGFVGNYFAVQHSALTGGDALVDLDFVAIDDGSDIPFIVQVVDVQSTTITVLNFDGTTPGGSLISMQKYRNNYHALVKVYAGLEPGHYWESQKPYELAVTLKLVPNPNNEVMFSVNEILKSYLEINNNDLLATLPNNIDFFTEFYITTQEAYDVSNGIDISIHYETENVDSFEGYAANAILEFKNLYSGYLSDYVMDNPDGKFLTLFETPKIFAGYYFDVSFIKNDNGSVYAKKTWVYSNGSYEEIDPIQNYDAGIYRLELQPNCDDYNASISEEVQISMDEFETNMDGWSSVSTPAFVYSADNGGCLKVTKSSGVTTDAIKTVSSPMQPFKIRIVWSSSVPNARSFGIVLYDVSTNLLQSQTFSDLGTNISIIDVTSPSVYNAVTQYYMEIFGAGATSVYRINSIETYAEITTELLLTDLQSVDLQIVDGSSNPLSESKSFSINCGCANNSLYLTWLNNLGGFDYWDFTDGSDYLRNVGETGETKQNIFPNWPKSYGKNADTSRKQTFRETSKGILVRSQSLTKEELEAIAYIKSSILVEIVYARGDKRRVLVDTDSWVSYRDIDKLYTLSFTVTFTDNIPAQRL